MNVFEFDNYRTYLKSELAEKISRNPNYSLRSMARNLGIASSTLSEVINGRANLSVNNARKIAGALNLEKNQTNYFCDLVQLNSETDPETRELLVERIEKLYPKAKASTDLTLEVFKQMSEWYHMAILEMPYLKNFTLNPTNVAQALGISKPQAELALERLLKLGFFELDAKGNYQRCHPDLKVQSEIKNTAMRKYYTQMLEKIAVSLEKQTPKERLSGYINMPIDTKALPEIDVAIDNFFNEVIRISNRHKNKTKTYHLSLHFINLMKESL